MADPLKQSSLEDQEGVFLPFMEVKPMQCPYCKCPGRQTGDRIVRRRGQLFRSSVWIANCGTQSNGNRILIGGECEGHE